MTSLEAQVNHTLERVTDGVAVGAVSSPMWLPLLQTTSNLASLLLPIAGLIWLIVQIFFHIKNNHFRVKVDFESEKKDEDEV